MPLQSSGERDLVSRFVLSTWNRDAVVRQPRSILQELHIGGRKPDVVLGYWSGAILPVGVAPLTLREAAAVGELLSGRGISRPSGSWSAVVKGLERRDAWLTSRGASGLLETASRLADMRIVAVEAKLKRIEEALLQAADYLDFADESYVLLPDLERRRVDTSTRSAFRQFGVGLLLQSTSSCHTLMKAARHRHESLARKLYVADRLARNAIDDR